MNRFLEKIINKWNKLSLDDKARFGTVIFFFAMVVFLTGFGLLMKKLFG